MSARRRVDRPFRFDAALTRLCPDLEERQSVNAFLESLAAKTGDGHATDLAEQGEPFVMSGDEDISYAQICGRFVVVYRFDADDIWFRLIQEKAGYDT
jgi:hypothetical protein